eukprot:scaffold81287_cov72-Phaeocystis_antarctica.AAC.11
MRVPGASSLLPASPSMPCTRRAGSSCRSGPPQYTAASSPKAASSFFATVTRPALSVEVVRPAPFRIRRARASSIPLASGLLSTTLEPAAAPSVAARMRQTWASVRVRVRVSVSVRVRARGREGARPACCHAFCDSEKRRSSSSSSGLRSLALIRPFSSACAPMPPIRSSIIASATR